MEEMVDFMLEHENYDLDNLIGVYRECVNKSTKKVKILEQLMKEEIRYRDTKLYTYNE
jgi:hypothetical protein